MNNLPSRIVVGGCLAMVVGGLVAYAVHIASVPVPTAQVAPVPPPPAAVQTPEPPAAPADSAPTAQAPAAEAPAAVAADTAVVDNKITTEVKSILAADAVTRDADLNVNTTQGVVVLSGTLSSQDALDHVKVVAQNVPDVKRVDTSAVKLTST